MFQTGIIFELDNVHIEIKFQNKHLLFNIPLRARDAKNTWKHPNYNEIHFLSVGNIDQILIDALESEDNVTHRHDI